MSHNKFEGNLLLDHYGSLLTEHQLEILNDYYIEDLSMQEIAENHDISRSAVSDLIKRTYDQLCLYENKLGCIRKAAEIERVIVKMESDDKVSRKYISELKKINRG